MKVFVETKDFRVDGEVLHYSYDPQKSVFRLECKGEIAPRNWDMFNKIGQDELLNNCFYDG
jgi:hypothetical protein